MKSLKHAVEEYINYRCNLGFTLKSDKLILNQFVAYMEEHGAAHVTTEYAIAFAKLNPHTSRVYWARRLAIVRRFTKYWYYMDKRTEIPPQCLGPSTYQRQAPYIYSDDEIKKILACCETFSSTSKIERYSYFTWYGLMIITGMRIGEVSRLERNDIDLFNGVITIHNSKFKKSRQIPLHKSAVEALKNYLTYRDNCTPKPKISHLFINRRGGALSPYQVREVFRKLLILTNIQRTSDGRQPRIMDFRHTFATNTLIRWYKQHINIDQHMPLLSTYLGHVHLRHTYWYLTATQELLKFTINYTKNSKRIKS